MSLYELFACHSWRHSSCPPLTTAASLWASGRSPRHAVRVGLLLEVCAVLSNLIFTRRIIITREISVLFPFSINIHNIELFFIAAAVDYHPLLPCRLPPPFRVVPPLLSLSLFLVVAHCWRFRQSKVAVISPLTSAACWFVVFIPWRGYSDLFRQRVDGWAIVSDEFLNYTKILNKQRPKPEMGHRVDRHDMNGSLALRILSLLAQQSKNIAS